MLETDDFAQVSCIPQDNDQTDKYLCDVLRKAIEGDPWTLHAQRDDETEFIFARAKEGISDSIHKYTYYRNKTHNRDTILFQEKENSKIHLTAQITNTIITLSYCSRTNDM